MLCGEGVSSLALYPQQGLLQGCPLAPSISKLAMFDPVVAASQMPGVQHCDLWLDDCSLDVTHADADIVAAQALEVYRCLKTDLSAQGLQVTQTPLLRKEPTQATQGITSPDDMELDSRSPQTQPAAAANSHDVAGTAVDVPGEPSRKAPPRLFLEHSPLTNEVLALQCDAFGPFDFALRETHDILDNRVMNLLQCLAVSGLGARRLAKSFQDLSFVGQDPKHGARRSTWTVCPGSAQQNKREWMQAPKSTADPVSVARGR